MAGRQFPIEALRFLRCPLCGTGFYLGDQSLRCSNGHNYDVARKGYINFLPGGARPGTADTADMVAAREAFLAAGHFAALRDFVADAAERALTRNARGPAESPGAGEPGCIADVGAGTGYYLAGVLDRFPEHVGLALDISKFAARRAARAHDRVAAVVCDAWTRMPVADAAASLVLDVFAPRNPGEFRRVLRPDGALLVVTPSPRHLQELVAGLGLLSVDGQKPERLERALSTDFVVMEETRFEERRVLTGAEAAALAVMGPSAHHLQSGELAARLTALGPVVEVTVSVLATAATPLASGGSGAVRVALER
jgi:23S rRNA (guanine745-N1)-methyltransferase